MISMVMSFTDTEGGGPERLNYTGERVTLSSPVQMNVKEAVTCICLKKKTPTH